MTTSKPPAETPGNRQSAAGSPPESDPLSGLPPMPKIKSAETKSKPKPAKAKPVRSNPDQPGARGDEPPVDAPPTVTKKELFTRVKARTGRVKGPEVRAVMDVLLNEIGAALVAGETLKVPALGTMKVQRRKAQAGADVVVCKLNRKKPGARAKDPLAKPAEES